MQIGAYKVIEHTDTVKPERFVVFTKKGDQLERTLHVGRRGGFRTWQEAVDAAEKLAKYGTLRV